MTLLIHVPEPLVDLLSLKAHLIRKDTDFLQSRRAASHLLVKLPECIFLLFSLHRLVRDYLDLFFRGVFD